MKIKHQQIIGSFLLGMMISLLIMQIGARVFSSKEETQIPSTEATEQTQPQVEYQEPEKICVLLHTSGLITEMELEEYLIGVILAEMPTSYQMDALQAQAVVARTYALKRQEEKRHPMNAVCTDYACCQAYIGKEDYLNGMGYEEDIEKAAAAVNATKGEILTYQGELIIATYFSCSGGRTEDAVAVWGVDYPYLQAVESPGEENMSDYSNQVYFSLEELETALDRELTGEPKSWLGWTTYTTGGGVSTMYFAGKQYSGVELRSLLKLDSTAFMMTAQDDGILVSTLGKGHRVGMSQCGAEVMALDGLDYRKILAHYYPGTRIDKTGNIE